MSNASDDAKLPNDGQPTPEPVIDGSPYGPAQVEPVPQAGGAPLPVARRSPAGWITGGVVAVVLGVFNLPRGLATAIANFSDNPGYALGTLMFAATLLTVGILLLVKGARVSRANRQGR